MDTPQLGADDIVARVLHRDGLMLVIDKPAGLPVHRGPKGGANLEDSFDALRFGLPRPPVLAHRLDRDTSGCLVLGRHRKATASLGLLFKHGKIGKTYWAVVEGGPAENEGEIDIALGRLDAERGWWQKPDPNGLPSKSRWSVMGRGDGLTWLALEPIRWLQVFTLVNPLVYLSEGFRSALTPVPHMSLWAVYPVILGFVTLFTWLGIRGFTRISRLMPNAFAANPGSMSSVTPMSRKRVGMPISARSCSTARMPDSPNSSAVGISATAPGPPRNASQMPMSLPRTVLLKRITYGSNSPLPAPWETWTAPPTGYSIA